MPNTIVFMFRSSSVRIDFVEAVPGFLVNSPTASPIADLMTPKDLIMPIIPAVAIPPIPICLA